LRGEIEKVSGGWLLSSGMTQPRRETTRSWGGYVFIAFFTLRRDKISLNTPENKKKNKKKLRVIEDIAVKGKQLTAPERYRKRGRGGKLSFGRIYSQEGTQRKGSIS